MSGKIRFSLLAQTSSGSDGHLPFIDVSIQVWRDNKHVETVKLIEHSHTDLPAEVEVNVLENYATAVSRVIARTLADVQLAAADAGTLHLRSQYEEETDAGR